MENKKELTFRRWVWKSEDPIEALKDHRQKIDEVFNMIDEIVVWQEIDSWTQNAEDGSSIRLFIKFLVTFQE